MEQWALAGFTELRHLGAGAFGRVVLARHDPSGQLVAIKYLSGSGDRTQFRHEAAILRQVVSPHVTRLYEFVEDPRGAAIVMEAVPGVALKAILDREPALPPEAALAILKGSLLGLAAAHSAHIVHRDYKPGNVLVQPNHQSKLVDFGIALLSGHSGQSAGTPAYMAPEQWRGGPATPATDVYAATCVFFLCVTGMRPPAPRNPAYRRAPTTRQLAPGRRPGCPQAGGCPQTRSTSPSEASIRSVTIDLATGQVLQLADIFPGVTSDDGAMALAERVVAAHPEGICGDGGGEGSVPVEFTAESFSDPYSPADDPIVQVVATPDGIDFEIYPSAFGYANACDLTASPVRYAELTDLMSPRAVELLTR